MIGQFRSQDLNYKGWLESVKESNKLKITKPTEGKIFFTPLGKSKKEIIVEGHSENKKGKVMIIIRTDRDYPQALGKVKNNGMFSFTGCTLGGVDHQIYAVLIDSKDNPILRSKIINVRLERK